MAQQTAMQKLIELLEYRYKVVNENCICSTLELTIEDATLLLAMEKEQIIDAACEFMGTNFDVNRGRAEMYYNGTYQPNQDKTDS